MAPGMPSRVGKHPRVDSDDELPVRPRNDVVVLRGTINQTGNVNGGGGTLNKRLRTHQVNEIAGVPLRNAYGDSKPEEHESESDVGEDIVPEEILEIEDGGEAVKEEGDGEALGEEGSQGQCSDDVTQGDPKKQRHAPGAIVRVRMLNFVTYTNVEFRPGPSLNMVIGPNGTGKSTLVCAICLGLGWSPAHLGRAKEVGAFVKHGCKEATIEIEVQGKPSDKINPVIKRIISENNNTKYFINNGQVTHKNIQVLMKSYSIQIDNLCQFLPQDRVAEFAALDPVSLLRETQRAAAVPQVLQWHEGLVAVGKEQKTVKAQFDADTAMLTNLEARQRALEPDVARLRERQDVLREIEMYKRAKPFARYRVSRNVAHTAKARLKEIAAELNQLKKEQEPTLKRANEKKVYRDKIAAALKDKKKAMEQKEKQVVEYKRRKLDETEGSIKDKRAELSAARKKERERRNDEIKLRNNILKLKEVFKDKPPEPDVHSFNLRIREKSQEMAALKEKADSLEAEVNPKVREGRAKSAEIDKIREEIDNLQSQAGQRENLLKHFSSDSYRAYIWIKENADKFEMPVFGPPIIECSVKDHKYVDIIEGLIRGNATAITCQSQKDYQLLSNEFFGSKKSGTRGMGLGDVTILNYSGTRQPTLNDQRTPFPTQELHQRYRMDGWALDFIEGPEAVLNMLCHEARIHSTPITLRSLSSQENSALESTFPQWATDHDSYVVRWRKEYGDDAKSTSARKLPPAQIFNVQQVDHATKSRLEDRIRELNFELSEIDEYVKGIKKQHNALKDEVNKLGKERKNISDEKEREIVAHRQWIQLGTRIEQEESKFAQKMNGNYKQEAERLGEELSTLTIQRAKGAMEFTAIINSYLELQNELLKLQLWDLEANSDVTQLEAKNQEVNDLLRLKQQEVSTANDEMVRAKQEALKDHAECTKLMTECDLSDDDQAYLTSINDRELSLEDLDTEIDVIQSRLSMLHEGNPNAIREFERRTKEIESLHKMMQDKQAKLEKFTTAIEELKAKWEPELVRIVDRISSAFSESFDKIGCAGEVRVHKAEDFEKWEIQIMVKFRQTEKLQLLTNQRQSGGERAVSTVFYLMALQSLAQAPFRVVDEINQGMDPRNERLVHHRMVHIACQAHTSQYFLITPKLLSNLTYHPRMKVHTINSGDWVEEDYKIDVMKCITTLKLTVS